MFPVLLVSNPSTKVVRRPCFTRAGQSFIRPKYLSCLSILMWKVCGRCWGSGRSTIKVSPLTNPLIANKLQEMSGYESGSNSVRIVFCCFIPFHSSVIQTRLSMIGYISLNATGKSIRVAINFIATIPVLLICHVKRNFSGDEFLRTVPKLTKHKETRHVHVVSSLEITEENCTKKT